MAISSICSSEGLTVEARSNRLLGALPPEVRQRWGRHLELVNMPAGLSLRGWGEQHGHVYFPTTASVSMLHITRGGDSVEVVAVGNEGMVGLPAILAGGPTTGDAVVRMAGQGYRLGIGWIQSEFYSCAPVMRLLLRYAQALMSHTAQSAICNMHHPLEQRLCRCFLGNLDHSNGTPLNLTHESLGCMLGVRREGVTCAALKLQRAGVIDYFRGRVVVIDRVALEAQSCECYQVVRTEYERLAAHSQGHSGTSHGQTMQPPDFERLRAAA